MSTTVEINDNLLHKAQKLAHRLMLNPQILQEPAVNLLAL